MGIALQGDLGNRIDAVLAIAMLNGLIAKMEARRIALCVSRPSIKAAQLADVVSGFYVGRVIAGPGGGVGGNPAGMIGMPETGPAGEDPAPITATLAKKGPDGGPLYTSQIARLLDTADDAVLLRNMLLAQNDGNATIVLAGQASGLSRLLALYGARPQIEAKCKQLVVAIGGYPAGGPDPGITADVAAARTVFAEWPTPLVAVGAEVGAAVPYPGASIEKDFAWSPAHPVVGVSGVQGHALRRARRGLGCRPVCRASGGRVVHPVAARHHRRVGRRADAIHAWRRREASLRDRGSGAEGAAPEPVCGAGVRAAGASARPRPRGRGATRADRGRRQRAGLILRGSTRA